MHSRPNSLPVGVQKLAAAIAPPTVSFTEDRTSMTVGQSVTLTITAASAGGTISSIDVLWGDGHHDPFPTPIVPLTASHSYSASGTFHVEVSATDNSGLVSSSSSTKTVTDIPPVVSFTTDKTSVSTNSPVTITISSSDSDGTVTSVDVYWGDAHHDAFPSPASSITASHSYTTVGTPSIEVDATDNAQLVSTASRTLTVTDIPPHVSFTADKTTTTTTGSPVTLTIASSDPDGTISTVDVFWGDSTHDAFPSPAASITASHAYTSAFSPTIEVDASDNAQLSSSSRLQITVTDIPPTVSFTMDKSTAPTHQPITLTITAADVDGSISSIDVFWGDSTHDSFPAPLAFPLTASHSYTTARIFSPEVDAYDNAGLLSTTMSRVTITDAPPLLSFTVDHSSAATGHTITLTITSSDPGGSVQDVDVFWGDSTHDNFHTPLPTISTTHKYSTAGVHTIDVEAIDDAGLRSSKDATEIITDAPPTVSFTEDKTSGPAGTSVTLTITSSDTDGSVSYIDVFWGDNTPANTFNSPASTLTATHTYNIAGTFTVEVDAHDSAGLRSSVLATKSIGGATILDPKVSFTEDKTAAAVALPITLTISASESGGTISGIQVNWGDGTLNPLPGTATTDFHAYATAGIFTLTVMATDSAVPAVTAEASTEVIITDVPPSVGLSTDKSFAPTGSPITATITSSDADGTVTTLTVNWGDGFIDPVAPGATATASHSYTNAGIFTVTASAEDNGLTSATAVTEVVITDIPPSVSFTLDKTSAIVGSMITATITSSDTGGTVASLTVYWGDGFTSPVTSPGPSTTLSHAYTSAGSFRIDVSVDDDAGLNADTSTHVTITDVPPSISFTSSLTTATTSQSITLTITAADTDGMVATISVNWSDGTINTFNNPTFPFTDSHTITTHGFHTVTTTATDNSGLIAEAGTTLTITDVPPIVSFTTDKSTIATGQSITITVASADTDGSVSTLSIFWGDGTAIDTTTSPAATLTKGHSYTSSGRYTISTVVTDNAGLTAGASTEVVISDRPPTISFTEDKTTTTKGQSITLTITSADPDGTVSSILLTWGDGTAPETINTPGASITRSHTYTIAGSFTVTVLATDNTGQQGDASSTKTITDMPPTVSFSEDRTTANTGQAITLTIASSDADGTVQTLTINWGDSSTPTIINTPTASTTASHAYTTAGSFNVVVTAKDDEGLTATSSATKTISAIDEPPVAHFTESATTALTAVSISFDGSTSTDPDGTITTYAWDFGDGGTGTGATPSHSYATGGPYTVRLTVTDSVGLTNSVTALKTITDRSPVAKFTESATTANTGQSITFDAGTSSDPDGTITGYHWDFGDGSTPVTSTTPTTSHTYTNPSPNAGYTVTLTVTDNSGNTATQTAVKQITAPANQPPVVRFTEDKTTASTGETITLTISATDADDTVASIMVDWGDGTIHTLSGTATTDTHAYTSTGNAKSKTFTVSVSATDSRGATSTVVQATKTVNDRPPIVSFTEDHTTVNTGQAITLSITSSDPDGTIAQTVVDWGDGTVHTLTGAAAGDTHAYSSTGISKTTMHTVSVTVTDNSGNSATISAVKTVNDLPAIAKFTESATTGTTGVPISFDASASSDPDGTITNYSWNFGDGNTGTTATPIHAYMNPGTYTVTLTVTDNSGNTATTTATKTINPFHIAAAFTESRTTAPTLTSISFDASGSSSTAGAITSFSWNFGDTMAGTGKTPSHSYAKAGTYTVTLTVTDAQEHTATASATKIITDQPPTVSFTEDRTTAFRGQSITLTITSGDVDGTVTTLKVDWGDTTVDTLLGTATTDSHSYTALGTYSVKVTATDNSGMTTSATATKAIVNISPTVSFTEDKTTAPTGTMITLSITAGDTDGTVSTITVNWGDNTPVDHLAGTARSDSHSYAKAGTYTVTVTATDNDGGTKSMTATKTITDRPPAAMFTESATTGQTGTGISFDASTSKDPDGTIASYSWSFGDGTPTGTGQKIDHTYTTPGTYTVTLTVTDDNGSINTATAVKIISQPQAPQVIIVFRAFDCDDYEHGVGQLDVLVNGHLVVNVPAGLFHLKGTGDYVPLQDKWVQLGPFNIGSNVTEGLNTIVFRNPLDSHECKVKNILITSGTTTLLNVTKTFEIEDESIKLTFSNPPLVLTSFAATPGTVNENMTVRFEANFTGGTGPYTCTFIFGDHHTETVTTTSHTCSTIHIFKESGSFTVTVKVQGAATSDRVTGTTHVHVQDQGETKPHHGEDRGDDSRSRDCEPRNHEHDYHEEHREEG